MSQAWLAQPERSNPAALSIIAWIALKLGRRVARAMLLPICVYYLAIAPASRAASRRFLGRALGRAPTMADLFRHHHSFAAVLLDRAYLLSGREQMFDVRIHGAELMEQILARGQGCVLLGAHLGSFEILRVLGKQRKGLAVKLVMYQENAQKVASILQALNPDMANSIINLGTPDAMLKVQECLEHGEWVGFLSDRILRGEKHLACPFLGEPAIFPTGPARLAGALKCPVVFMTGLYWGGLRYDVHFELLADGQPSGHGQREQQAQQLVRGYVERLEYYCRSAPYNWFNFYDFWNEHEGRAD